LFFVFAGLYAKDWYLADPEGDAIEAGKEEAGGDVELLPADSEESISTADTEGDMAEVKDVEGGAPQSLKAMSSASPTNGELAVFSKSFMAVFIAEWGDRTQIAMVGQHASQPLVPVFLGSTVAFFLLTLSAVGAATLLNGQKLRERVVFGFSACCFAFFGVLALQDAISG